jgi:hypothetical protein
MKPSGIHIDIQYLIGDPSGTKYTEHDLDRYIEMAVGNVSNSTGQDFVVASGAILPEPSGVFEDLIELRAACLIRKIESGDAASKGISVRSGEESISLGDIARYTSADAKSVCDEYKSLLDQYLMGGIPNPYGDGSAGGGILVW